MYMNKSDQILQFKAFLMRLTDRDEIFKYIYYPGFSIKYLNSEFRCDRNLIAEIMFLLKDASQYQYIDPYLRDDEELHNFANMIARKQSCGRFNTVDELISHPHKRNADIGADLCRRPRLK